MDLTVFLGAPGCGKGTQAKRLSESHGIRHVSTGDLLRDAIQAETDVGKNAQHFLDRGELVPDSVMIRLVEENLKPSEVESKVVLDGFPRTLMQAETLDRNKATQVDLAIYFKMPQAAIVERITGRRSCERCGTPYHVKFQPPKVDTVCDQCSGPLVQRPDDSEGVAKNRIHVWESQNDTLTSYYKKRNRLEEIDADRPIPDIHSNLAEIFEEWFR